MSSYCLITPCRNEAEFARRTIDSVLAQTVPPTRWIIVDDGSTDATPSILAEYESSNDNITVIRRADRGKRALGGGVIDTFYDGYDTISPHDFDYVCKFDLDLDLPPRYFEKLIERMDADPLIGTASGKPYFVSKGELVAEDCGDENSVGMIKFYRPRCLEEIGGFVRALNWDGIDGHRCRMLGWKAVSWDAPELRFVHLRPMGTSDRSWWTGRMRHGAGQWFMGTGPIFLLASAARRLPGPPPVTGSVAMVWGYTREALKRGPRYDDPEFRRFLRRYQRRSLLVGKRRATHEFDVACAARWSPPPP